MSEPTMSRAVEAIAFGGPENLALVDVEVRAPGSGEVGVDIRAAGVNPYDVKVYGGTFGADESKLPMRLGNEAAGVVRAVGPDVTDIGVGDEVILFPAGGAYASHLTVARPALTPKPERLSWEQAAGVMLTGATAVHTLAATDVSTDDVILIHGGAGGVGQMAVQLAVLRGARVIATASPRNHELLRELGAEPVEYGDGLADRVRELAPEGIDAAIDLVGTAEALEVSLAVVPDHGRIATIANFAALAPVKILGGGPGADPGTEIRNAARAELARLADEGRIQVRVDRTFGLAEAADAHRYIVEGHPAGKVILVP